MAPPPVRNVDQVDLDSLELGADHRLAVALAEDGTGRPLRVPVMVLRGQSDGPVVGITAVVHGNELNGIPTIHRLFELLGGKPLTGTVVAVPIVNVPGYLANQREFHDGTDLNRIMPGRPVGTFAEVYAHRFLDRIVDRFDYLIDLHTASFGRVNALYIRADLTARVPATLARLAQPQIIVHNQGADGTLRGAAAARGIPAITIEVGDPQKFQKGLIEQSRIGVQAVLAHLGMIPPIEPLEQVTVECARSYWLRTEAGGVLYHDLTPTQRVRAGDVIALQRNAYGDLVHTYRATEDAVVIGCSMNPVAHTGARIVHLGVEGRPVAAPPAADESE
jgi:uncharacterized protein